MDYTKLYAKCSKENKTCSHCKFMYYDPMLKDIPVDESHMAYKDPKEVIENLKDTI